MRSYHVKENHNGSVVNKIIQYKQTDKLPVNFLEGKAFWLIII